MFYSDRVSKCYRMGDVIEGFAVIDPNFHKGSCDVSMDFDIKIKRYSFYVILTPCCSIENNKVALVPLCQINNSLIVNRFIMDNLLKINEIIRPKLVYSDEHYKNLSDNEKMTADNLPDCYTFVDKFIYEGNAMLPEYSISRKLKIDGEKQTLELTTTKHMISFKDAISVSCDYFARTNNEALKILELTPEARSILRNKLTAFYGRVPDEDKPYLI